MVDAVLTSGMICSRRKVRSPRRYEVLVELDTGSRGLIVFRRFGKQYRAIAGSGISLSSKTSRIFFTLRQQ